MAAGLLLGFVGGTADAQTLSQIVTTGQPSDWALFGFDGSAWTPALPGQAYLEYRIDLTDVPPPPDAGVADSGVVPDAGFADAGPTVDAGTPDAGSPTAGLPPYSGGACPTLAFASSNNASGDNSFVSAGLTRAVRLIRSGSAPNPAVLFTFHSRGSQPSWGIDDLGLSGGNSGNYIIVAPSAAGNGNFVDGTQQWLADGPPASNPDVQLFDDLLTCLHTQVGVNLDRVSASGFSAGGLFTSYLLIHRSERLSAAVVMSGGLLDPSEYLDPIAPIPTMVSWGGPSDAYYHWGQTVDPLYESAPYTHSFHLASIDFADRLEQNGQLVVRCDHGGGHAPGPVSNDPSRGGYLWPQSWPFRYLYDHVRGQPSPYATSFPTGTMPASCVLP